MPVTIEKEASPELKAHANAAHDRIQARAGDMLRFLADQATPAIMTADLPPRTRYIRLREVASKAAELVRPDTPCRDGCAACCYQAVPVLLTEARIIADKTGRALNRSKQLRPSVELERVAEELAANTMKLANDPKPCPFLKDDRCSIYEDRPLACREHHVLHPDASRCRIGPDTINVRSVKFDLGWINAAMFQLSLRPNEALADMRDWFPG